MSYTRVPIYTSTTRYKKKCPDDAAEKGHGSNQEPSGDLRRLSSLHKALREAPCLFLQHLQGIRDVPEVRQQRKVLDGVTVDETCSVLKQIFFGLSSSSLVCYVKIPQVPQSLVQWTKDWSIFGTYGAHYKNQ